MRLVSIAPLPLEIVALLDCLEKGQSTSPEQGKIWKDYVDSCAVLATQLRRVACHPRLEEVGQELEAAQITLGGLSFPQSGIEALQEAAFSFHRLATNFSQIRQSLSVTRLPDTNELLLYLHAVLRGNLPSGDLGQAIAQSMEEIDHYVQVFKQHSQELPPEVRQSLLVGLDSLNVGFAQLRSGQEALLPEAGKNISNGAQIVETLKDWEDNILAEHSTPVPLVGEFVEEMLELLARQRRLPDPIVAEWEEELFWTLQDQWAISRHEFFMPRKKKDQLVEQLDTVMYQLKDLSQLSPDVQESLLLRLKSLHGEVNVSGFSLAGLEDYGHAWLADLFMAALAGGVPRAQLSRTAGQLQGTDLGELAHCLQKYLETDDRDYLLDGLSQVIILADKQAFQEQL